MHDKGFHDCLSEDWLLENLPEGWNYDCHMGEQQWGFLIYAPTDKEQENPLFIPLYLLRTVEEVQQHRHVRRERDQFRQRGSNQDASDHT